MEFKSFIMWKVFYIVGLIFNSAYTQNYDSPINVSLTNRITINKITLTPNSNNVINVNTINIDKFKFFVIQIHSFNIATVISSTPSFDSDFSVNGTNIGLVQILSGANSYKFYLMNQNTALNKVLIAVIPYEHAPIPGGCNMEFKTEIAPYQQLQYTNELVGVQAQAASMDGHFCEAAVVKHDFYHFYLSKSDTSMSGYFDAIENMLTVTDVKHYGTKVASITSLLGKLYNNYKGVGSVYTVVATYKNLSSAYIPIVSYGCDLQTGCFQSSYFTVTLQCVVCLFGFVLCVYGHFWFDTQVFLFGTLIGGLTTYVIFYIVFSQTTVAYAPLVSLVFGCVLGAFCLKFWRNYHYIVWTNTFSILTLGILLSSIVYYAGLNDIMLVYTDFRWVPFILIVFATYMGLTWYTIHGHILASAVVGSYAIVSIFGSCITPSLEYIFITALRKATIIGGEIAVFDSPYQWFDFSMTLLWLALCVFGLWCQIHDFQDEHGIASVSRSDSRYSRMCECITSRCLLRSSPNSQTHNEHSPLLRPTSDPQPTDRTTIIHPRT